MLFILFGLVGLFVLIGALFVNLSPEFGRTPSKEQKVEYAKTDHFEKGVFVNQIPSEMEVKYLSTLWDFLRKDPYRETPLLHQKSKWWTPWIS